MNSSNPAYDQPGQMENNGTKDVKEVPLSWLVWVLGCLFYFYEFLLQVSPGVMQAELGEAFHISAKGFGILGGVYFYSYAIMQVPAGVLLDRLGPHKLITFATLTCAVATLFFARTHSFQTALIARFCIGFGSAFAAVGAMKLAANWFPAKRFALLTGLMVAIGMSGAIGGEKPLARFIEICGWRQSLTILGVVGIVLAAVIYFIARDELNPKPAKPSKRSISSELMDVFVNLKNVFKNKQLWLIASYGGLVYMGTIVFCGLWGVPFLVAKYGLSKEAAASVTSLVFVGWIIGSPSWGLISDRIGRRKPPLVIGTAGALITLSAVLYLPPMNVQILSTLLFLFGIFSSGFLPAFSIAKEISCQKNCATALSFMNMMNMAGVAIAQPLVGVVLDKLWHQETLSMASEKIVDVTQRVYSVSQYELSISILPVGLLVALIILPFVQETYCRPNLDE